MLRRSPPTSVALTGPQTATAEAAPRNWRGTARQGKRSTPPSRFGWSSRLGRQGRQRRAPPTTTKLQVLLPPRPRTSRAMTRSWCGTRTRAAAGHTWKGCSLRGKTWWSPSPTGATAEAVWRGSTATPGARTARAATRALSRSATFASAPLKAGTTQDVPPWDTNLEVATAALAATMTKSGTAGVGAKGASGRPRATRGGSGL